MAPRFWVGGTGTWDASDTTHWAASSNGAGGQTVPGASDDVTFDGSSGGGTVTVNTTVTIVTLTMSAFTGTLDFATNNNNITLSGSSGFTNTGSGTRTLNMGNGTWTLSNGTAIWTQAGATNLTFNANSSTLALTGSGGTTSRRLFLGTSRTYNIITIASGVSPVVISQSACTVGTLTISPGNTIVISAGATLTVTTLTNVSGSSSAQTVFGSDNPTNGRATISSANNWTGDWCGFYEIVFSGGGTFTGSNSYDFKNNSGITITAPTVGAGGGVGVIGS